MIFASSHPYLGDAVPSGAFFCTTAGTCTATNPGTQTLFKKLQSELNRVRKLYGMPADVWVDGKIGSSTTAKLIKTAQRIATIVPGMKLDPAIEGYAIEISGQLPSSSQVARDASDLVSALMRNGYAPGFVPPPQQSGALIDPYLIAVGQGSGASNLPGRPNVPANLVVGPTASAGGMIIPNQGFPLPTNTGVLPAGVPKGLAIVGVVIGVLGIAGLAAVAWQATR
jgi:hypothetical protein